MNYSIFCCYRHHTTSLAKQEIKKPLNVLEDIYQRRSLESFKKDLWEFFWIIYRDQLWKKKGAAYFYSIYMDLIRLTDALWLINTYQPELSSRRDNHQSTSKLMNIFNQVFDGRRKHNQKIEKNNQETNLDKFYNSNCIAITKIDIYNCLQVGLNASYMRTDKYEYLGLRESNVINIFLDLEKLIKEGQNILNKSKTQAKKPGYKRKHLRFASDVDYPSMLNSESIIDPLTYITDLYQYDLIFEQIADSIKIWEKSFYEKNFWLKADSPGNILYLVACLKRLIDSIWLLMQIDIIRANKKLTNSKKKLYPSLSEEELNSPLLVIKSFFEHKKLHEWKHQLDEWTNISLSYTETVKTEDIAKTSTSLQQLLKFIEATHLLTN
ncbi:hypothetical protein [Pedobacter nyackensis]|uniref:Uncharacterized protein n=1 Tax=Pedobacter nyackensis TaxID=475255 RepID=A0A1W2B788_9SPHI|nr:hypothetical protein [Pedobacter nyackensis]SMC68714.1 hypothetical protein SAMN04488101_102188 [Pedobacter nyackensis]